nr:MAG TPA: hypothetical protein [Caudoviricetes sp.]
MSKDKILMPDGSIINRTYFLQDLKVGDVLVGYSIFWEITDKYIVSAISEEYATLKRKGNDYDMSLKDGIFHYTKNGEFDTIFFKTQEELDAYLDNLKLKKDLRDEFIGLLHSMNIEEVDIELVMKLKAQLKELL